jgi:hypothetical protein
MVSCDLDSSPTYLEHLESVCLINKLIYYVLNLYFFVWFVKCNELIHHHLIPCR